MYSKKKRQNIAETDPHLGVLYIFQTSPNIGEEGVFYFVVFDHGDADGAHAVVAAVGGFYVEYYVA